MSYTKCIHTIYTHIQDVKMNMRNVYIQTCIHAYTHTQHECKASSWLRSVIKTYARPARFSTSAVVHRMLEPNESVGKRELRERVGEGRESVCN